MIWDALLQCKRVGAGEGGGFDARFTLAGSLAQYAPDLVNPTNERLTDVRTMLTIAFRP